jgi:hypothetical protein
MYKTIFARNVATCAVFQHQKSFPLRADASHGRCRRRRQRIRVA